MGNKKVFSAAIVTFILVGLICFVIFSVVGSTNTFEEEQEFNNDVVVVETSTGIKREDIKRVPNSPSVLCLAPSFVEIMYYIDKEDHIMAVTDGCDYPSDATTLPNLGSSLNLDWELIEGLPIDIVMLTQSHMVEHARFAQLGKKVIVGDVASLDSIINNMWALGQLFKEEKVVTQWMVELDQVLTDLKKKTVMRDARGDSAPRVLFILSHEPDFSGQIVVAGSKLFYSDVIEKAGGENAFLEAVDTAVLTFEELIALSPDIVIDIAVPSNLSQRAEFELDVKSSWDGKLKSLEQANRSIKFKVFTESWARRPGPRVIELIDNLGKVVFE